MVDSNPHSLSDPSRLSPWPISKPHSISQPILYFIHPSLLGNTIGILKTQKLNGLFLSKGTPWGQRKQSGLDVPKLVYCGGVNMYIEKNITLAQRFGNTRF